MKKTIYSIALAMAALVAMQSCTDDESTYGIDHTSIVINGIDSKYDVISFAGKHLQINPTVNSTFPESDLEYRWLEKTRLK